MTDPNDFLQSTKDILAKRAGNKCSNPWCGRPTSGPHSDDTKAVNLGEAAHIRGARPGSARFDATMTPEERRTITNGIWLCRECARLIDLDAARYSVEILYKWKREHETTLSVELSAQPAEREVRDELARLYRDESPAALQLAIDTPDLWEHLLTIELIRDKLRPIQIAMTELDEGVVYRSAKSIALADLPTWLSVRTDELTSLIDVLGKIVTVKIPSSWGPDGKPGDAKEILHAANLLRDACYGLLEWEYEVRRTVFPDGFEDLFVRMHGWTHGMLQEMAKIPAAMSAPIESRTPGVHKLVITFQSPDGVETMGKEFSRRFRTAMGM